MRTVISHASITITEPLFSSIRSKTLKPNYIESTDLDAPKVSPRFKEVFPMFAMLVRLRLIVLGCGALALIISLCGNSAAGEAADEKFIVTEKAKLRKKVEGFFRKGRGDQFAIAVVENTFQTGVSRTTVRNVVVKGELLQETVTEISAGGEYVPAAEFKVIEGQEAAVDSVVDHMAKYIRLRRTRKQATPKGGASEAPPPAGDWKLIGRFADATKAEAALNDAKVAFESLPNWKIDSKQ